MSKESKLIGIANAYKNYLDALSILNDTWAAVGSVDRFPLQFGTCSLIDFSKQVRDFKLRLKRDRNLIID